MFKDIEPDEFKKAILNRTLIDTKRWGKYFVLRMSIYTYFIKSLLTNYKVFDKGPSMVAHFGMTGGIRVSD